LKNNTDNVTSIVDANVFNQAAPRSASGWTGLGQDLLLKGGSFDGYPSAPPSPQPTQQASSSTPSTPHQATTPIDGENSPTEVNISRTAFEQLLSAFATVSRHNLNLIVDFLIKWRNSIDSKEVPPFVREKLEEQLRGMSKRAAQGRLEMQLAQFHERKELAADYIFCLALLLALGSFHQPELNAKNNEILETECFERFKRANSQITAQAPYIAESRRRVLDLVAELVGVLSPTRFQSITAQVLALIIPRLDSNTGRSEAAYLIRGAKYARLRLGTANHLNDTLQFLKGIYQFFSKTKKSEIKTAVCEAGANMLSPLAAHEYRSQVDYREWFDLMQNYLILTLKFGKKAKYYLIVYPFMSTLLCVCSPQVFQKYFWPHVESLLKRYQQERSLRLMSLDCLVHVLGFYLKRNDTHLIRDDPHVVTERLHKVAQVLLYPGRRTIPSHNNDQIYDALIDVIVTIAGVDIDFAMNHMVLEMFKSSGDVLSENVLVALRAIMAIADQFDIGALLLDDEHSLTAVATGSVARGRMQNTITDTQRTEEYPQWVIKLIERANRYGGIDQQQTQQQQQQVQQQQQQDIVVDQGAITSEEGSAPSTTQAPLSGGTIRISSPFSSFRYMRGTIRHSRNTSYSIGTLSGTVTSNSSTLSGHHPSQSFSTLSPNQASWFTSGGLLPYQGHMAKMLGGVLRQCEQAYGTLLETNNVSNKSLDEVLSRDKYSSLRVYVTAILCISRIIPEGYSPRQLMTLLCRSLIHQHREVREAAWEVLNNIMDFRSELRPILVKCLTELALSIDSFKSKILTVVLQYFGQIMRKWVDNLESARRRAKPEEENVRSAPAVYGKFKKDEVYGSFDAAYLESAAIILLCNPKDSVRLNALEMLYSVRRVLLELNTDLVHNTVADVLDEIGVETVRKLWHGSTPGVRRRQLQPAPTSLERFLVKPGTTKHGGDLLDQFMRELGQRVSEFCPMTAHVSLTLAVRRVQRFNDQIELQYKTFPVPIDAQRVVTLWSNFLAYACAVGTSGAFEGTMHIGIGGLDTADSSTVDDEASTGSNASFGQQVLSNVDMGIPPPPPPPPMVQMVQPSADHETLPSQPQSLTSQLGMFLRRKSTELVDNPKSLYDLIIKHLYGNYELQLHAVVNALGGIQEQMLEVLFESLKPVEVEAFSSHGGNQKRKKKKDTLRVHLSRIYIRLARRVSDFQLSEREPIREKFLSFIDEQASYLASSSGNAYALELQPLRHNLFVLIEIVYGKLSRSTVTIRALPDARWRADLTRFAMQWTGYGETREIREREEQNQLQQAMDKCRDNDERKILGQQFRHKEVKVRYRACQTVSTLLRGIFFDTNGERLREWSRTSRFHYRMLFMRDQLTIEFGGGGGGVPSSGSGSTTSRTSSNGGSTNRFPLGKSHSANMGTGSVSNSTGTANLTPTNSTNYRYSLNSSIPQYNNAWELKGRTASIVGSGGTGSVGSTPTTNNASIISTPSDDLSSSVTISPGERDSLDETSLQLPSVIVSRPLKGINLSDAQASGTTSSNNTVEAMGMTVLRWIDEVLSSTPSDREMILGHAFPTAVVPIDQPTVSTAHNNVGELAIMNALDSNARLLMDVCVDQCYSCNIRVSYAYFSALVKVVRRIDTIPTPVPILLCVVIYMLGAHNEAARDLSLDLLHMISTRYFIDNSPEGNYPLFVTGSLPERYQDVQLALAEKLAKDHPQYAHDVLDETYRRLEFLSHDNQRLMLRCLRPWIAPLKLDDDDPSIEDDVTSRLDRYSRHVMDVLFACTHTYGDVFPEQVRALWKTLAKNVDENVPRVVSYLVDRCESFVPYDASESDAPYRRNFAVAQEIAVHIAHRPEEPSNTMPMSATMTTSRRKESTEHKHSQRAIDEIVRYLERARDVILPGTSAHHRQSSPNLDLITRNMTHRIRIVSPSSTPGVMSGFPLSKADIALVLLAEVAGDHAFELRKHLPLMLQYLFVRMDHKTRIVSSSARALLIALVHGFVVKRLMHNDMRIENASHLEQCRKLIDLVTTGNTESSRIQLWNRDPITINQKSLVDIANATVAKFFFADEKPKPAVSVNVRELTSLVEHVVTVFRDENNVNERWGYEALRWAVRSSSLHNVVRSYQIYRTLRPTLTQRDLIDVVRDLYQYLDEMIGTRVGELEREDVDEEQEEEEEEDTRDVSVKAAVVIEIVDTLRVLTENMGKSRPILFTPLFWLCVALLHTDHVHMYVHALQLLRAVIDRMDMDNDAVQNVIWATKPMKLSAELYRTVTDETKKMTITASVQTLVLRSLTHPLAEPLGLDLLTRFTPLLAHQSDSTVASVLFDPLEHDFDEQSTLSSSIHIQRRLLMNVMGLLPRLCLHIADHDIRRRDRCRRIAEATSEACESYKMRKLAKVFSRYSKGSYQTRDNFLLDLRKPFSDCFFPRYETAVFDFLIHMLRNGPQQCHASVLALLHSFLLHASQLSSGTRSARGVLGDAEQRERLISATATLLKGPLWTEATRVLDVAVRGSSNKPQGKQPTVISSTGSDDHPSPSSGANRDAEVSELPLLSTAIGEGTFKTIDMVRGLLKRAEKQQKSEDEMSMTKKRRSSKKNQTFTSIELLRLFDDNQQHYTKHPKSNSSSPRKQPSIPKVDSLDGMVTMIDNEFEFTSTGIDSEDDTTSDSDLVTDNFTDTHTETDLASSRFNVQDEDDDIRAFEDRLTELMKGVKLLNAYPRE
jgi:hypothetical protein